MPTSETAGALHPALAFQQEVLSVQQWSTIRRAFLTALQKASNGIVWSEPSKLWRHSQEALGKWVLSQVARASFENAFAGGFFSFVLRRAPLRSRGGADGRHASGAGSGFYNEQLIRDLSLKSDGAHNPEVVERIKALVREFNLVERCRVAHSIVIEQMKMTDICSPSIFTPVLRKVNEDSPFRTAAQARMRGPAAEINIARPKWHHKYKGDCSCLSVSIPWGAWRKLIRCYDAFGVALDQDYISSFSRDQCFLYRAASVMLRYEIGLATGSLQLCADIALKQHLHARGYHVVDLCASPINAYMGEPQLGVFAVGSDPSFVDTPKSTLKSLDLGEGSIMPNRFCSAFYDTDRYFGSVGSALHVDPVSLYDLCSDVNSKRMPLLLTLDVPYDEDLCELLFQKLVNDMKHAIAANDYTLPVDYVLVLPLWWDVPMPIDKRVFTDTPPGLHEGSSAETSTEDQMLLEEILQKRCAILEQGHRVAHHWTQALGAVAGGNFRDTKRACDSIDAAQLPYADSDIWVVFDGVFLGNCYAYFCTSTNRCLRGVTATEVVGLSQPRPHNKGSSLLKDALHEFYGP